MIYNCKIPQLPAAMTFLLAMILVFLHCITFMQCGNREEFTENIEYISYFNKKCLVPSLLYTFVFLIFSENRKPARQAAVPVSDSPKLRSTVNYVSETLRRLHFSLQN